MDKDTLIIGKKGNYIVNSGAMILPEPDIDLMHHDISGIKQKDVGYIEKNIKNNKKVNAFIRKHKLGKT